jgi:peroxiredoxin
MNGMQIIHGHKEGHKCQGIPAQFGPEGLSHIVCEPRSGPDQRDSYVNVWNCGADLSRGKNRSSFFSLFLALVSLLCLVLAAFSTQAAEQVEINAPAPDFTLPTLEGKDLSLSSLKGKVVLVAFWSIYCHVCQQEMPKLDSLYKKYKEKGLEVIGVNIDREPVETIQGSVKERGLSFPILLDGEKKAKKAYQARAVPTAFILDRNGIIVDKVVGTYQWSSPASEQFIEKLLKKK